MVFKLSHIGNFTTIGGPNGTPAPIDGTFALSHQLFFERFLLPNLQVFVQQSQIYPKPAEFRNDGNSIRSTLGYIVGANPVKDQFNDRKNPIYEFQAIPAKDGQPAYYQGHVDVTQELEPFASPSRGEWTKFYAEGNAYSLCKFEVTEVEANSDRRFSYREGQLGVGWQAHHHLRRDELSKSWHNW